MQNEERVTFLNNRGQALVGILHHPDNGEASTAAILCHGMESNKESEKLVALSQALAKRGILTLRFDFAYAGESSGKFEDITYSGEVEDLRAAYDFIQRLSAEKIAILGSSMGGTVALLFAAEEKRVAALATIAAPLHPEKITEAILSREEVQQWRREGFLHYHGRRINMSLLEDIERLDVAGAVKKIVCPVLLLHGDRDDTVPVAEANEIYDCLVGSKRLVVLSGADHRLSDPSHLERALEEAVDWLSQHLG
ncbi:MAG: alpha/beta fold hydrolase [Deltaproteobacteria bacterium]|nr:alpha/beta fold hydrolase [Deltaproteobacteria bacterium]